MIDFYHLFLVIIAFHSIVSLETSQIFIMILINYVY